jgi:hypothetical protein
MPAVPDYVALARQLPRGEFVERFAQLYLVGVNVVEPPHMPIKTVADSDDDSDHTLVGKWKPPTAKGTRQPMVLALRKTQDAFASMITVGRTGNNDLVLGDRLVSKFHAFFRVEGGRVEVSDAGSRNGTWVGMQRLVPKGPAHRLNHAEVVRFAHLHFRLLDAGGCWDFLQASKR